MLSISDRYSPRKIFFICSVFGSVSNLLIYFIAYNLFSLLVIRFITGFLLTGIYLVGMKIAAGWYKDKLGNTLGLLVGSLVLGTSFPHLIKSFGGALPWEQVLFIISTFSIVGGIIMYLFVPDGPYISCGTKFNPKAILTNLKYRELRSSALGYFGHMWELYTFWALVPLILIFYLKLNYANLNISFWSFLIIASGSIGCIVGGMISKKTGSAKVAFIQLALSAPKELIGSGLTLVNSIGFAITIPGLWFAYQFLSIVDIRYALVILGLGPVLGLNSMKTLLSSSRDKIGRVK